MMHANLQKVGGYKMTATEVAFAEKIMKTQGMADSETAATEKIDPFSDERAGGGSTDVGDISWVVPTASCRTATWVPGTPAHSWQAVAAGGTSFGRKGMMIAAKTITSTAIDLFLNPQAIIDAKAEFIKRRGNYKYEALLGDRKPALNYRD